MKVWMVTLQDADGHISTTVYDDRPSYKMLKDTFTAQFNMWGFGWAPWPGKEATLPTHTYSIGPNKLICQEYDVTPLPKEPS